MEEACQPSKRKAPIQEYCESDKDAYQHWATYGCIPSKLQPWKPAVISRYDQEKWPGRVVVLWQLDSDWALCVCVCCCSYLFSIFCYFCILHCWNCIFILFLYSKLCVEVFIGPLPFPPHKINDCSLTRCYNLNIAKVGDKIFFGGRCKPTDEGRPKLVLIS